MHNRAHAVLPAAVAGDESGGMPPVYDPLMMAELAGLIAHEINQPLSGILSSAGAGLRWLKRDSPDLGEVERNLQDIRQSVQRADAIIRELRALIDHAHSNSAPAGLEGLIAAVSNRSGSDRAR